MTKIVHCHHIYISPITQYFEFHYFGVPGILHRTSDTQLQLPWGTCVTVGVL